MKILTSPRFYQPAIYILLGIIIYAIIKTIILKIFKTKKIDNKKKTIISLTTNVIKYLIVAFVVLSILNVYGVNTTSIVASIGIIGVVLGLAVQDLVRDLLSGILIIFDNQYNIGDTVLINGFKGEVVSLGLISTKIRGFNGDIKSISNSSFKEVIIYNMSNTILYIDLPVAYGTDIEKLEDTLKSMKKDVLSIENVKDYSLLGVNEFNSSSISYLVSIECAPNKGYQIKRDYYGLILKYFKENNIEIPYNKIDVNIRRNNE